MSEVILIRDSSDEESSIKQMNEEVKEENPVSKPENGLNEAKSSSVTLSSKEEDDRINSTELTNELFEQVCEIHPYCLKLYLPVKQYNSG